MYRPISQRRLNVGDRVRATKGLFSLLGDGTIRWIGIHKHRSEVPMMNPETMQFETVDERILSADVEFDGGTVGRMPLEVVVSCRQIELYESLQSGDLIVYGRSKQAQGLVISNLPRRKRKDGSRVVSRTITVLEDGMKRSIPFQQEIMSIQRARDYLEYE